MLTAGVHGADVDRLLRTTLGGDAVENLRHKLALEGPRAVDSGYLDDMFVVSERRRC